MRRAVRARYAFGLLALAGGLGLHAAMDARGPAVTFAKDVAPILYKRCAGCHRPGEVAPFPLLAYQDAKLRANLIDMAVEKRLMPPWKPEPGFGDFAGAEGLSDEEIETIRAWVAGGAVEGDPRDMPPLPRFPQGWALGSPDLVLRMAKPFDVPPQETDVYRCFVLPTGLTQDKYLVALEDRPGNRRVVHHAIVVQDAHGAARRLEQAPGEGYPCFGGFGFPSPGFLGFWTPGTVPRKEPEGVAKLLRAGSDLVLQVHFHPGGHPEQEQSTLGLYFADRKPERIPRDLTVSTFDIDIPPGAKNFKVAASAVANEDLDALSIIPHAHLLAREVKAVALPPDGPAKPLIWIKDWDFNWQRQYWFSSPVRLPAGTRVQMEITYDNSVGNPRNPNHPPRRVTWGEQTTDEMAEIHLEVVPVAAPPPK